MADNEENEKPQGKNPLEQALNTLSQGMQKDALKKLQDQAKVVQSAHKAFSNEKTKLHQLLKDFEQEKADLKELLQEIQ